MTSPRPLSRDQSRMLARILALADAYGAQQLEDLARDLQVVVRVEYMTLERRVESAYERGRRATHRVGVSSHPRE